MGYLSVKSTHELAKESGFDFCDGCFTGHYPIPTPKQQSKDKFEEKLTQCGGNLERAAVALAQMWRSDSGMRQLETQMIVADKDTLLVVSGTGEVIDPDEGVVAIGSGGNYALAAARALVQNTDLSAHDIAEKALHIAASICVFTNDNVIVEDV